VEVKDENFRKEFLEAEDDGTLWKLLKNA